MKGDKLRRLIEKQDFITEIKNKKNEGLDPSYRQDDGEGKIASNFAKASSGSLHSNDLLAGLPAVARKSVGWWR